MSTHKKDGYKSFSTRVKKRIVARDGGVCKYPGCTESASLDVHHIDGDKGNHSEDNLITLCHSHHSSIERSGEDRKLAPVFSKMAQAKPSKRAKSPKPILRSEEGKILAGSGPLNPIGRPREGESWAGVLRWAGELTGNDAANISPPELAREFKKLGTLKLKQAASLRAFAALLFDPTAGLLNAVMDRSEGKLTTPVANITEELMSELDKLGLTIDDIKRDSLAADFFRIAGVPIGSDQAADDGTGAGETECAGG